MDRVKRSSLYRPEDEGGLSMVDNDVYISALKISWIKSEIMNRHDWQRLFDVEVAQGRLLWERSSEALRNLSESVKTPFW